MCNDLGFGTEMIIPVNINYMNQRGEINDYRRQSKMLILSTKVNQKSLKTEFLITIKHNVSSEFLIRVHRLLRAFSIAAYPVWIIPDDF